MTKKKKTKNPKMNPKLLETRWKIPCLDYYIIRGRELSEIEKKIVILEAEFKGQCKRIAIEAKMTEKLLHQISVMTGRLRAPECPKCGGPKRAGGIQWIDHAECFAKDKSKKKRSKDESI